MVISWCTIGIACCYLVTMTVKAFTCKESFSSILCALTSSMTGTCATKQETKVFHEIIIMNEHLLWKKPTQITD